LLANQRFTDPEELLRNPEAFGGTPPFVPNEQVPSPTSGPPAVTRLPGGFNSGPPRPGAGDRGPIDRNRTPSIAELILRRTGRFGEAVRPATNFIGDVFNSARSSARQGFLAGVAPDFTRGVLLGDQNRRAEEANTRQNALASTEIAAALAGVGGPQESPFGKINPSDFTTESLQRFQNSGDFGDLVARDGTPADPAAVAAFKFREGLSPEQQRQFDLVQRGFSASNQPGVGVVSNRGEVLATEQDVQDAQAGRAGATRQATADVGAPVELQGRIDEAEQFIERLLGARNDLQSGRLNTGFIAGRAPALSDAAQRFDEIASTGVLNDLASGSFGQLNTSELQFVKDLNIARTKNEDVNIDQIDRLIEILQREVGRSRDEISRIQGGRSEVINFGDLPE